MTAIGYILITGLIAWLVWRPGRDCLQKDIQALKGER